MDINTPPKPSGQFWMIWNPSGRAPTRRHMSADAAQAEAERLARHAPGHVFVVLEAKYALKMVTPPPPPVEAVPLSMIDDEIPF